MSKQLQSKRRSGQWTALLCVLALALGLNIAAKAAFCVNHDSGEVALHSLHEHSHETTGVSSHEHTEENSAVIDCGGHQCQKLETSLSGFLPEEKRISFESKWLPASFEIKIGTSKSEISAKIICLYSQTDNKNDYTASFKPSIEILV